MTGPAAFLEVQNLKTYFFTYQGVFRAVDDVSFYIERSETVGLVGETGCGKSVTTRSIMRLVNRPGKIVDGKVIFEGRNILSMSEREVRERVRGRGIAMIFQKPMSSLNPVFTIEQQFVSLLKLHHHLRKRSACTTAIDNLAAVALPEPEEIMRKYPHELSGRMQQRVLIAMALACEAKLLIADEPTTALDVSVQLQILKLLAEVHTQNRMAIFIISHDLGVVSNICDRIIVMYAGTIVEDGPTSIIVKNPQHPYTQGLIKAVPDFAPRGKVLGTLQGEVPNLLVPPRGCRFHPRCPEIDGICRKQRPSMIKMLDGHFVACHARAGSVVGEAAEGELQ